MNARLEWLAWPSTKLLVEDALSSPAGDKRASPKRGICETADRNILISEHDYIVNVDNMLRIRMLSYVKNNEDEQIHPMLISNHSFPIDIDIARIKWWGLL